MVSRTVTITVGKSNYEIEQEKLQTERMAASKQAVSKNVRPVRSDDDNGAVREIIIKWANYYGVSPNLMIRIATCESGLDPTNWNGRSKGISLQSAINQKRALGLFQFKQATFDGYSKQIGLSGSLWSVDDAAHVAAWAFANGHASAWECK